MIKILVTGGAGFIGSHLCERLVGEGHEVTSLDNYFTGSIFNHISGVRYVTGSTKDIETLIDPDIEIIYHLGEYSRVEQSFEDVELVLEYNKKGTFAVLEFVRKYGARLIYSGSSTKFADDNTGRDQSPYAWSKASNTDLVINYGEWFGIDYAITYFYNVYGGREIKTGKYATVVALFLEKVRNGEKISVVNPGSQMRNFTYIDDIINGIILVGEKGEGDGYGIGSDTAYTIATIAEMIAIKGPRPVIEFIPERPGNRMMGEVRTSKTKALGWVEKGNLMNYIMELDLCV